MTDNPIFKIYGQFPFSFSIFDILKGVGYGAASYAVLTKVIKPAKPLTPKTAFAYSALITGAVSQIENLLDNMVYYFYGMDTCGNSIPKDPRLLLKEVFQSCILQGIVAGVTAFGIHMVASRNKRR